MFALDAKQSPVDILLRKQYQLTDSSQSKNLSFDAVRYYTGYPVMLPSPYKFLNGPIAFNYTGEIEESSAYVKIEVSGIEGKIIHFDYDTKYLLAYRESEFILYRCLVKMGVSGKAQCTKMDSIKTKTLQGEPQKRIIRYQGTLHIVLLDQAQLTIIRIDSQSLSALTHALSLDNATPSMLVAVYHTTAAIFVVSRGYIYAGY